MERITLEVDSRTAKKWRYITQQQQKQVAKIISQALELLEKDIPGKKLPIGYAQPPENTMNKILENNKKKWPEYKKLLDKGRKEAETNGLTEAILNKLLSENND
jgi:hypothetical protein